MCYAIPGRVINIKDKIVTIDYFGEKKEARNEISLEIGDYVYAQAGFVVQKIKKEEAEKILAQWAEAFKKLKAIDISLAKNPVSANSKLNSILNKEVLSKEDLLFLLKSPEKDVILKKANFIRQKSLQNSSCIHGIIEFSNHCANNCLYCGLRKDAKIKRYRLSEKEIVNIADFACNSLNFKALVLQSGEDYFYKTDKILSILNGIKNKCSTLIALSIGDRSLDDYKEFYNAGARAVLIRFETSNPEIYKKVHEGGKQNFEKRIALIKQLKDLGYLIITGAIIGLPEQTEEDIVNDILFAVSLNPDMYSFGPFIPASATPFFNFSRPSLDLCLKTLAILRLAKHDAKILETTALETLDKNAGKTALLSGANSLMINITPLKYRKLYSIYDGKADSENELKEDINKTINMLYSIGRAPTDIGI